MTNDQLIALLKEVDLDIPKVKALLASLESNSLSSTLILHLFPNLASILPLLAKLGPILDFLQKLDETILRLVQQ